jgi:cysteinyl-tRNA synthetase
LDAAAAGYKNIVRRVADLQKARADTGQTADLAIYNEWHDKILAVVSDNLKTAEGLVLVQEFLKDPGINAATKVELMEFVDRLFGLLFIDRAQKLLDLESIQAPDYILKLADERADAKAAKDWTRADDLRGQIDAAGWNVVDTKDGHKLVKKQT